MGSSAREQARGWHRRFVPWLALALAVAVLGAACGGDDSGSGSTDDADAEVDPNGTFVFSLSLAAQGGVAFDPVQSFVATDMPFHAALYDTLLRRRPNGEVVPGLAESATGIDPSTIEVKLRPDLKFTDGSPLDADAAKFSLLRTRNGPNGARAFKPELLLLSDVEVVNPTTFRIKLTTPSAGAYFPLLYGNETTIVSKAAVQAGTNLNNEPVGAGPFVLGSYTPGQRIEFRKNPDHWDAEHVRVAGFTILGIEAGPQVEATLRAGGIDMMAAQATEVAALEGGGFGIYERAESDSTLSLPVCKTTKPLDNVKVRQALQFATNRDELNTALYAGRAEPMEALFTEDSPYFPEDLKGKYAYNVDTAKKMLAEAGVPNPEIGVITIAGNELSTRFAEVLQQQWAKAGIKLNIVPSTQVVADFFQGAKQPLFTLPSVRAGMAKVTLWTSQTPGNVCNYQNPSLNQQVQQLAGLAQDSPEAIELWKSIQELVFEDMVSIWGLFTPVVWAYDDDKIGGMGIISASIPYPDFFSVYVKRQ